MENDNQELVSILTNLNIPPNEARTYAALVPFQTASIRKIASLTGINRGTTYEALKHLTNYGLVSVKRTSDKREQYTAESPERINTIIREKRRELVDIAVLAKELIPRVLASQVNANGAPLVRFYEGDEGIVTILKDVLYTCGQLSEPMYYTYSSSIIRPYLYKGYSGFTDRRIADNIRVHVIKVGTPSSVAYKQDMLSERKQLPSNQDDTLSSYTIIYGNKVATISITDNNTPYGVVIEDASASTMQKLLFEQLWNTLL
jgi:sugar-specific transcriptional regulator TrmB